MSLTTKDQLFLQSVRIALKNKPELFSHIINAMHAGVNDKIQLHLEQAHDAETALAMLTFNKELRKFAKNTDGFKEKIEDYRKKYPAYIRWDWLFEEE